MFMIPAVAIVISKKVSERPGRGRIKRKQARSSLEMLTDGRVSYIGRGISAMIVPKIMSSLIPMIFDAPIID